MFTVLWPETLCDLCAQLYCILTFFCFGFFRLQHSLGKKLVQMNLASRMKTMIDYINTFMFSFILQRCFLQCKWHYSLVCYNLSNHNLLYTLTGCIVYWIFIFLSLSIIHTSNIVQHVLLIKYLSPLKQMSHHITDKPIL